MQKKYNEAGLTSTSIAARAPRVSRLSIAAPAESTDGSQHRDLSDSGQGTPDQVRQDIERIPFVTGMGDDWFRVGRQRSSRMAAS